MAMVRTRLLSAGLLYTKDVGSLPGGPHAIPASEVYVTPPGYRAIVRDIRISTNEVIQADQTVYVTAMRPDGTYAYLAVDKFTATKRGIAAVMDACLEAGDALWLESSSSVLRGGLAEQN